MKLETLVKRLSVGIKKFDKKHCDKNLEQIEAHKDYKRGNKKQTKKALCGFLGYDFAEDRARGSLNSFVNDHFFLKEIGVKKKDIGKVITRRQQCLSEVTRKNASKKIDYLVKKGINRKDVGKIATRHLTLLIISTESMEERIDYLISIGIREEDIGKIIRLQPTLLHLDIKENMKPKVSYLRRAGIRGKNLAKLITANPSILAYDLEKNLKPTFEYLTEVMSTSIEEIIKYHDLLSYSLELRMKPRYEFFLSRGKRHKFKAKTLLASSDKELMRKTGAKITEFNAFREKYYDKLITQAVKVENYKLALNACNYSMKCTESREKLDQYEAKKKEIQKLQKAA